MKRKVLCVVLPILVLSGCANANSDIDYEDITTEAYLTTESNITDETTSKYNNVEFATTKSRGEESTTSYEDFLANQNYVVSGGIRHDEEDNRKIKFTINGVNTDKYPEYYMGMLVFVNGIPQYYSDENDNTQYLSNEHIDSSLAMTVNYFCEYNDVPKADKYICRKQYMLMPNTIITNQSNFFIGHLQTVGSGICDEIECEPSDKVDVAVIEGKRIKHEDGQSTNILVIDGYKGVYNVATVLEKKDVIGEYNLEITPDVNTSYIISFWGNGKPIQLGEHMYYQINVEAGDKYQYTFELTEEIVNSVDNFYSIVCPVGEDGYSEKTRTKIFVDKYRE